MKYTTVVYIITVLLLLTFVNCRKKDNIFNTSASISFSQDTILFDTLFTTVGSTTKKFKIYNTTGQPIKISSILLEQQTNSMFRINVDGVAGVHFNDVEIPAKDSLFVFVEVTIDPNNGTNPMIVQDKILFSTNGHDQQVVLNAFGQDAYFHVKEILTTDLTWPNDKPHVIYGYFAVDSAVKLTIPAGTKVHGFNNSVLYIYKGSLDVQGTLGNEVIFSQSRTEDFILSPADSVGGQWRGIYFYGAKNSQLVYTQIKNATIGIQIDTLSGSDSVTLENVRIDNSSFASIVTQGGNLYANSCLFGNAGVYTAFFSIGGNLLIDQCTFANYWPAQRNDVLFAFKDYYTDVNNNIQYRPFNRALIKNSIIYGNNTNELGFDTVGRVLTGSIPNIKFDHCLIRSEDPVTNSDFFNSCWRNNDPNFANPLYWDFHTNSSAINQLGTLTNPISDLEGNSRTTTGNDLGCYNIP